MALCGKKTAFFAELARKEKIKKNLPFSLDRSQKLVYHIKHIKHIGIMVKERGAGNACIYDAAFAAELQKWANAPVSEDS